MKLSTIACTLLITANTLVLANTSNESVSLNEIIITGDKVEKNLQDSLGSIQVFNDYNFQNSSSLNTVYDLFNQTANVNRNGQFSFNIRGINSTGLTGASLGPKTANVQIDGVSLGIEASRQSSISTWDIAQVEVLKGPQSTTQGRNSLAGALIIKTKDPEFDANGAVELKYGTNNTRQFSAMQTGSVTDNLALRLSLDARQTDGFVNNEEIRGDKYNEQDNTNVRGKALYKFGEEGTVLLTLSDSNQDQNGRWLVDEDGNSVENTDTHYYTDAQAHSLEINYPINRNWKFKSISSYANEDLDNLRDLDQLTDNDGDGNADTGIGQVHKNIRSIEQEFRFNYTGDRLSSVIGLYYSKGEGKEDTTINDQYYQDVATIALYINGEVNTTEKFSNTALFLNADYALTEKLDLIVGLRVDRDTRKNTSNLEAQRETDLGATFLNDIADSQIGAIGVDVSAENNTTNVIPKFGVNYKINENITTGILFSKGYRPGGLSTNSISGETATYEKESTDNIELSFKSQWLDKRLTFNTSIFYTKWKDQQVSESGDTNNAYDKNTVNAGESTLKGIEFDIKAQINNEVSLYSSVGFLEAKFDDYVDGNNDYTGKYIKKSPKITSNIGVNYRNDMGYFAGGNIVYTGRQYQDSANENEISPFTITNVKVGYEENDWAVYLYSNNVFNKKYTVNDIGDYVYERGDERVTGINIKYYW